MQVWAHTNTNIMEILLKYYEIKKKYLQIIFKLKHVYYP